MICNYHNASGVGFSSFAQSGNEEPTPFNHGNGELVKFIKSYISDVTTRVSISMVNHHTASSSMSRATFVDINLMQIEDVINKKYFESSLNPSSALILFSNSTMRSAEGNHVLQPYIFEKNNIYMA